MKVTVEYSAQLRKTIGRAAEELDLAADTTVQQAIAGLAEREGEPVKGLILAKEGRLSSSILLCVNDEQVFWSTPRALKDGDTVTITTPIAGGVAPGCSVFGVRCSGRETKEPSGTFRRGRDG